MTTNTLTVPFGLDAARLNLRTSLRRLNVRALERQVVGLGSVAGVIVLLATTGCFSPSSPSVPLGVPRLPAALTAKPVVTHHAAAPKPKQTSAPATVGCGMDQQAENTVLFAACPDFALDFGNLPNGSVNTQLFNVYTGKPEANGEAQLYTSNLQNLRIENGNLILQAAKDSQQGSEYTSARIDTKNKEDFLYGKLSIRATLPAGIGTWPAIWMLPTDQKYAALSPPTDFSRYRNDGEIDIAESTGTEPYVVYGIAHSLAYPPDGPDRSYYDTTRLLGNDSTFHDYEVDWTPTTLAFLVDGQPFFSITKRPGADYHSWPYDQPFYLVLNLALGGSWGGTDRKDFPADGIDPSALPASMKIQSVHYYPYIGPR